MFSVAPGGKLAKPQSPTVFTRPERREAGVGQLAGERGR